MMRNEKTLSPEVARALNDAVVEGLALVPGSYALVCVDEDTNEVAFAEAQETTPTSQVDARIPGILTAGPECLGALTDYYRALVRPTVSVALARRNALIALRVFRAELNGY